MTHPTHSYCRHLRRALPFALLFTFACSPGDHLYGPVADTRALSTIVGTWRGTVNGNPVVLTICEDPSASLTNPQSTCQVEHVVSTHSTSHQVASHSGVGCGGCPMVVSAPVRARLETSELGTVPILTGNVRLGDGYEEDPYALPYDVSLSDSSGVSVWGTITRKGYLVIDDPSVDPYYKTTVALPSHFTLDKSTPPVCP